MVETATADGVVLVGIARRGETPDKVEAHLQELSALAQTRGWKVKQTFVQRLAQPHTGTFIGKGKMEEIQAYIHTQKDVGGLVFDEELSPVHVRNLEKYFQLPVSDRSLLILDIFLQRAQTSQAKIQVGVARYEYLLPRLTRMWTHLERQRGGVGTRGGAGEKEIETDKRQIRNQITLLKKRLKKVERQAQTQRQQRNHMVRVALVGYTNVGKSTLMNALSKSRVPSENKLFATLDTTVRRVTHEKLAFLLSDTVGFVHKLPHNLIASFRSTLNEVREADLLLHVIDISSPTMIDQVDTVHRTLQDICRKSIPTMFVFNKADKLKASGEEEDDVEHKITSLRARYAVEDTFKVSILGKEGLDRLKKAIFRWVARRQTREQAQNPCSLQ